MKLARIQQELKAPKGQTNNFGKYKYRSCEDILESVKPLLEPDQTITLSDELIMIGNRYYVKATATFKSIEGKEEVSVTAYAREAEDKKGMDFAQITGATSSYARKYALNGLFAIDDTKDADNDDNTQPKLTDAQKKKIDALKTVEETREFYKANRGNGKEYDAYVVNHGKKLEV